MAELEDPTSAPNPTDAPPEAEAGAEAPAETSVLRRRARRERIDQDDVTHSAIARSSPARLARALELATAAARVADDNRGGDILLLDLRKATSLVDFFLIITASSRRLSHAIAEEIDKEMKKRDESKLAVEGSEEGRWVLIDYGDFVVHVFSGEARAFYSLEDIWGDADRIDWHDPSRPRPPAPSTE